MGGSMRRTRRARARSRHRRLRAWLPPATAPARRCAPALPREGSNRRILALRAMFGYSFVRRIFGTQADASVPLTPLTRAEHGAHETAARDPHLPRHVHRAERVRAQLRGDRHTVQL